MKIYKYSGAGNDFIVMDARHENAFGYRLPGTISSLCSRESGYVDADGRVGADGLMMLSCSREHDFRMEYYNADGSGGMMCGNGGRCIVAFADFCGIRPANGKFYVFEAADGLHSGEIVSRDSDRRLTVRLGMIDAFGLREVLGGVFLNTGTRHFVKFVPDVETVDIDREGPALRRAEEFAPEGANVNFVQRLGDGSLKIRTFEKGVEAETLACGTGITAAAIASVMQGEGEGPHSVTVHARTDTLRVDFVCGGSDAACAREVFLTGPAERIF